MPLENLLTLVEKLRERVDDHGPALRQNEMLTRYALIDPLLRELGWDTEDPGRVIPEYKPGKGSADYALLNDGKPVMILEAKKLDMPLRDAVTQGINYCIMQGTNYLALTDGRRWEIYETHKPVPIDDKRVVAFDLKDQSATEACLKALALWRPSVISGRVESRWADRTIAEALALCRSSALSGRGLTDDPPNTTEPPSTEEPSVQATPTEKSPPVTDERGQQPLSEVDPKLADSVSPPTEDQPPPPDERGRQPRSKLNPHRIQPLVQSLMKTLLEDYPTLLDDSDIRNLGDLDYCKTELGLQISLPVLRRKEEGRMVSGHSRYWKDVYAGKFYVCSEWWKDHHPHNARILLRFVNRLIHRQPNHPGKPALERHREEFQANSKKYPQTR